VLQVMRAYFGYLESLVHAAGTASIAQSSAAATVAQAHDAPLAFGSNEQYGWNAEAQRAGQGQGQQAQGQGQRVGLHAGITEQLSAAQFSSIATASAAAAAPPQLPTLEALLRANKNVW
jgi:hypothetical protein